MFFIDPTSWPNERPGVAGDADMSKFFKLGLISSTELNMTTVTCEESYFDETDDHLRSDRSLFWLWDRTVIHMSYEVRWSWTDHITSDFFIFHLITISRRILMSIITLVTLDQNSMSLWTGLFRVPSSYLRPGPIRRTATQNKEMVNDQHTLNADWMQLCLVSISVCSGNPLHKRRERYSKHAWINLK